MSSSAGVGLFSCDAGTSIWGSVVSRERGGGSFREAHECQLADDKEPEVFGGPGDRPREFADQEPTLENAKDSQCPEGKDLDEDEDAVRREQVGPGRDADLRVHVAGQRNHDEADERERRVAGDHRRDPSGVEGFSDQDQGQ